MKRIYWFWQFWQGVGRHKELPLYNRFMICWNCSGYMLKEGRWAA